MRRTPWVAIVVVVALVAGGAWYWTQKRDERRSTYLAAKTWAEAVCRSDADCLARLDELFDGCFTVAYSPEPGLGDDVVEIDTLVSCLDTARTSQRTYFDRADTTDLPFPAR
jgi:hypothetical protein